MKGSLAPRFFREGDKVSADQKQLPNAGSSSEGRVTRGISTVTWVINNIDNDNAKMVVILTADCDLR